MALLKLLAQAEAQPSINKAKLLLVNVSPPEKVMNIQVAKGYEQSGAFVVKSVSSHIISGEDYDTMMQAMGSDQLAVGSMLEEAIWAKLVAMGVIEVQ